MCYNVLMVKSAEYSSSRSQNNWDSLKNAEFAGEQDFSPRPNPRQQHKIEACLLLGDSEPLSQPDVLIDDIAEENFYNRLADGRISDADQRHLLSEIRSPLNAKDHALNSERVNEVFEGISKDRHKSRILSMMTTGNFDGWRDVTPESLAGFALQYETPMDFESKSQEFLDLIARHNPEQKTAEYIKSMREFKLDIYGERQEYWEQMQFLRREAFARAAKENGGSYFRASAESAEALESLPFSGFAVSGITRAETRGEKNGAPSEDSYFVSPEDGIFAVFDGAGGHAGGAEASRTCAEKLGELTSKYSINTANHISYAMNELNKAVCENENAGITTAVIAKLVEDPADGKVLTFASVGDSRLYIVRGDKAYQMTKDEGEGKYIYNSLGKNGNYELKQIKSIVVQPGDNIVLCTDGVTGDYDDDLMSPEELGDIVSHAKDEKSAADALISRARKHDDRTALVIKV